MGTYIAVEGIDGTGKSTQAARLADFYGALLVAEPGGTPYAQTLRGIVKDPSVTMGVEAEALLFASARADLLRTVVAPATEHPHQILFSDRSVFSSLAYQGFRDGKNLMYEVWGANAWATKGHTLLPELVLQIDLDADTAVSRRSGRGDDDRMEAITNTEDLIEGFNRVRNALHRDLRAYRTTWVKIDGLGTPDEVFGEMVDAVDNHLRSHRSHSPEFLVGPASMDRVHSTDVPAFEAASEIAIGVSFDNTRGASGKSHFFRGYGDSISGRENRWTSLCRASRPHRIQRDESSDPTVTCLRCLAHASAVSHLDFTSGVDTSASNR